MSFFRGQTDRVRTVMKCTFRITTQLKCLIFSSFNRFGARRVIRGYFVRVNMICYVKKLLLNKWKCFMELKINAGKWWFQGVKRVSEVVRGLSTIREIYRWQDQVEVSSDFSLLFQLLLAGSSCGKASEVVQSLSIVRGTRVFQDQVGISSVFYPFIFWGGFMVWGWSQRWVKTWVPPEISVLFKLRLGFPRSNKEDEEVLTFYAEIVGDRIKNKMAFEFFPYMPI